MGQERLHNLEVISIAKESVNSISLSADSWCQMMLKRSNELNAHEWHHNVINYE